MVRAFFCDLGVGCDEGKWGEVSRLYRRMMDYHLAGSPNVTKANGGP
jgi:hypothetical protein